MYAVIETGGKQYRVEVGTELEVELLDVEPGKTITLDRVLLVADGDTAAIGRPVVEDASVSAEVVTQTRGPKLISFKYRPKARSRVKKGHRQELTVLRISDIVLAGKSAAEADTKAKAAAKTERQKLADAAEVQAAKDAELAAKLAVGTEAAEPKAKATTKAEKPAKADADAKPAAKPAAKAEAPAKATTTKSTAKPAAAKPAAKAAPKTTAKAAASRDDQGSGQGAAEDHRHQEGRVDEMAHKKAGGSVKNGRDSVGQRLGVKAGDGQLVTAGSIIVRQRGMTFLAGPGTGLGRDYTVFATVTGKVKFEHATKDKKRIRVDAVETAAASA